MPRGIPRTPSFPDTFSLDPSDDDDQYEDPSGEFDIESLKTASVAIPNHQVSKRVSDLKAHLDYCEDPVG